MLLAFVFLLRCAMVENGAPDQWRFAPRPLK
jgi:hypothetical protein